MELLLDPDFVWTISSGSISVGGTSSCGDTLAEDGLLMLPD